MEVSNPPLLVGTLAFVVGLIIGVAVMALIARRSSGGRSLDKLREEFDEYRDDVNAHFEKSSELFRDMTEKYRDVYNHLAAGAQAFGRDLDAVPRLEMIDTAARLEGDDAAEVAEDVSDEAAPEPQAETAHSAEASGADNGEGEVADEALAGEPIVEPIEAGERVGEGDAILVEGREAAEPTRH